MCGAVAVFPNTYREHHKVSAEGAAMELGHYLYKVKETRLHGSGALEELAQIFAVVCNISDTQLCPTITFTQHNRRAASSRSISSVRSAPWTPSQAPGGCQTSTLWVK